MIKQRKNLRIRQAERIAHLKRASISELEKEGLIVETRTTNKYGGGTYHKRTVQKYVQLFD